MPNHYGTFSPLVTFPEGSEKARNIFNAERKPVVLDSREWLTQHALSPGPF